MCSSEEMLCVERATFNHTIKRDATRTPWQHARNNDRGVIEISS